MTATYISEPTLTINGAPAPPELIEDILQISVEESLHLPAMFTLVINNEYLPGNSLDKPGEEEAYFAIGMPIKIGFTSSTTAAPEFATAETGIVLEGEITSIETHFTGTSQAPLIIRGYDLSHRLHRGRYNRSFQNMADSDIVIKIINEVGLRPGQITPSGTPHLYVFQENQTNMEFLRERAACLGFELFIQDGLLNFRRPIASQTVSLKWLTDLNSLRVRVSSAEQVNAVEVRAWDYKLKQAIVSTATGFGQVTTTMEPVITSPIATQLTQTAASTTGVFSVNSLNASSSTQPGTPTKTTMTANAIAAGGTTPKMIVVDRPVFNTTDSESIAKAVYNELGGQYIYADGLADGNPYIRAGRVVNLLEMGKYTGQYYVTETRHLYHQRIYTTEFSVRGLQGADLISNLSPKTRLQPGQTMLVGIVTNNQDPLGIGRVRVKFPTLTNDHESNWARMVQMGAGLNRGFDCLPEIGDEVLVGFEHGDIHRPYVIGGVWNGLDKPPVSFSNTVAGMDSLTSGQVNSVTTTGGTNGTVRLRTLKTRVGHQLHFVEEDNSQSFPTLKGIQLRTAGPNATGPSPVSGGGGSIGAAISAIATTIDAATKICSLEMSDSTTNPGIAAITGEGQGLKMSDTLPLPSTKLSSVGNISITGGAAPLTAFDTAGGIAGAISGVAGIVSTVASALGSPGAGLAAAVVNPQTKVDIVAGSINIVGVPTPPTNNIILSVGSSSITINALGIVIKAPMIHLNPPFNPFSLMGSASSSMSAPSQAQSSPIPGASSSTSAPSQAQSSPISGALSQLQAAQSMLQSPLSQLQAAQSQIQAPLSQLQAAQSMLQSPLSQLQAAQSQTQAPLSQLQAAQSMLQAPLSQLQAPLTQLQTAQSILQAPLSQLQAPLSQVQAIQSSLMQMPQSRLQASLGQLQTPLAQLQSPLSQLQSPLTQLQSPLSQLRSPLAELQSPLAQLRSPLAQLQSPLAQLQTLLSQPELMVQSELQAIMSQLQTPLNQLQTPLNQLQTPLNQLQTPLLQMRSLTQ